MNKDLSFKPVDNHNPKTLTSAQVDAYNEQGYLKPFRVYNDVEVVRNRAYFDYPLAEMRVQDGEEDPYAIDGYHTRCDGIYAMARHPAIRSQEHRRQPALERRGPCQVIVM